MIILGQLFWTTTGAAVPPKPRSRGSIGEYRQRMEAIQRDDEEIMSLAALLVASMGDGHGD